MIFFLQYGEMAQSLEATIVARVKALFDSRTGLSQKEFAAAIGVSQSWPSHFFAGNRPANDIHQLAKIARYFSVNVGYLLGEKGYDLTPDEMTLLASWRQCVERKDEKSLRALRALALSLCEPLGPEELATPSPGAEGPTPRNGRGKNGPPKGKRR